MLGTAYDNLPAEILLHYKSGKRHSHIVSVKDAKRRATVAIERKSVHWVKVLIPNPDNTKQIVALYEPATGWTRKVVDLPTTRD